MRDDEDPFAPPRFNQANVRHPNTVVSPLWLLAEEYRVVDATLLILGLEPQGQADQIAFNINTEKTLPVGFDAAKNALSSALKTQAIEGNQVLEEEEVYNQGYRPLPGSVDIYKSTVNRDSLILWLEERNFTDCYFFPTSEKTGFRDPEHPRYSAKLAAVVEAWESFDPDASDSGTAKQRIAKWLRLNAGRYNLTSEDGSPSESVIEELSKVANWATSGGAPRQTEDKPDPD